MKLKGSQIITTLRENLKVEIGRHLYGVLASYSALAAFENNHLEHAKMADGTSLPKAMNASRCLLDRIGDADLRELVKQEGKFPTSVKKRLNREFDALLANILNESHFVILKDLELIFALELDLETIRARASNQNHILLLLPGEKRGDHINLFSDADQRFHRQLPFQLMAENHLWELDHG